MSYDFKSLCIPCYQELLAFATKRTNNRAAAEDIVQDSMARALQAWERWEPVGDPTQYARAWLYRIVTNVFSTHYQREKLSFKAVTETKAISQELYQSEYHENPYQLSDTLGDEVREALSRIRPEWAEVVRLVYIDEMPAYDVAKLLGLPAGTVRSRMARGRLALARILSPLARQRFGLSVKPESLSDTDEALDSSELISESNRVYEEQVG